VRSEGDREVKLKLAEDLALPADEAVTQKYGFIGRSGSGKSYAAMRLAELFLGQGAQIIALDWVGIWWSLRLAADGKAPGFEHVYIFGGEHADVDLRPESGALMADLVVDKHISIVLDVMHFRKAERTRFATAFAEQFFHRKKTARTACHLFIEEAQAYLPQMVRGDEARMVGVFEDIGKVGRNYGIGNSLISQRPQSINKDILNQVEVLLAFQTNGPQERKAIAGWTTENTDAGAALVQELPKLRIGHAQVWSPQWLRVAKQVHISKRITYDASSTPTQKAKAIRPKTLAKADLEQLGEQITATIEKAKADDPRELRKQIAELKKQLGSEVNPTGIQPPPKIVEKFVLKDGQLARAEKLIEKFVAAIERDQHANQARTLLREEICNSSQQIAAAIASTRAPVATLNPHRIPPHTPANVATSARPAPLATQPAPSPGGRVRRDPPAAGPTSGNGDLGRPELKILGALAELEALGLHPADKQQLGLMAGYTNIRSGGFSEPLGRLVGGGYIVSPRAGEVAITDAGRAVVGPAPAPLSAEELQARILDKLTGPEQKLLRVLLGHYPDAISKEQLAAECDPPYTNIRSGGFSEPLGRLNTLGIVESPARGEVVASRALFLER
jgi:hypothetical protein